MADVEAVDVAGKIALVRGPDLPLDNLRNLSKMLLDRGATGVVYLRDGETVEGLDDDEMRRAGWVRTTEGAP